MGVYGVTIYQVDPAYAASANVVIHVGATSVVGGYADGVLGCTTDLGEITLIQGWDWYTGADAAQIAAFQYDFQTIVTHELGHALGLGHSATATSVMYATLSSGATSRVLATADLNLADTGGGPSALRVAVPIEAMAAYMGFPTTLSIRSADAKNTLSPLPAATPNAAYTTSESCGPGRSSQESLDRRAVAAVLESVFTPGDDLTAWLSYGEVQGRETGLSRRDRALTTRSDKEVVDLVLDGVGGFGFDDALLEQVAVGRNR